VVTTPWHTQNFLRHPSRIERLLDLTSLRADDLVLDLGAGHGQLTSHLARRCRQVIAVEKDPLLATSLQQRFQHAANVSVRCGDALAVRLPRESYKVVANIPFDITARLIRRLTSAAYGPVDTYLAVQAEAAERVLGRPRMTLFGALIYPWFEATIVHRFRRTDFNPAPRVEVVFLRLRKRGPPSVPVAQAAFYRDLLTMCFCSHKPTLRATLVPLIGARRFQRLELPPSTTPGAVSGQEWVTMVRALAQDAELPASMRSPRRGRGPRRWVHRRTR
jgi:23S rRNA (adenine-N6)-dimethyltransferase